MAYSIKVSYSACRGCVNCIKSCPTEAIRVVDGSISILKDLCVDCGECLRVCERKALGLDDDDWDIIRTHGQVAALPDPTFFAQFGSFWFPDVAKSVLASSGINLLIDEMDEAFDLSSYAIARSIESLSTDQLPLISAYCPAVVRLVQLQFPELLSRIVNVENALDIAADLWRKKTKSFAPITLFAPCPAKISMVRDPLGREPSAIQHVVSLRKVVHTLMASGIKVTSDGNSCSESKWRFYTWCLRGGESKHIQKFAKREITHVAVSGLRNTIDLLQQLELGRLRGVDFVECRTCDLGCVGGVAVPESRFLSSIRNRHIQTKWEPSPQREDLLASLYAKEKIWKIRDTIPSKQRLPLSDNLSEAMTRMRQMKAIFAELPHIDCGACGRPSCMAMAEDIVRDQGEITDCIFKLKEGISSLASQILTLSDVQPHTLKKKR